MLDCNAYRNVFVHSFIQAISKAPLQIHCYSEALPTQHGYCAGVSRSATGNCELRICHTWRLERDLNPRPSGRKASTLPMRHHIHTKNYYYCKSNCMQSILVKVKVKFMASSRVFSLWNILDAPTIVGHCIYIPSPLILFFHKL